MKRIFILLFLIFPSIFIFGSKSELDSITTLLKSVINNKDYYEKQKRNKIYALKRAFDLKNISLLQEYDINRNLSQEYEKFISDSAVYYIQKNLSIAEKIGDKKMIEETRITLASLYSTTGQYVESKQILDNIDREKLDSSLLPNYYEACGYFCDHYGQSNMNLSYFMMSNKYTDSLLAVLDPNSEKYRIIYAKSLNIKGQSEEAKAIYLNLLDQTTDENPKRALFAFLVGSIYRDRNDVENQKKYFSISVIADIKNAIKDNASQQALALVYSNEGNIDAAYVFMKSALEDAVFGNIRYRVSEGSAFYPYINATYQAREARKNEVLRLFIVLISVLSLILVAAFIYIYKQMKRVAKIRKELYYANLKLNEANSDLQSINEQLKESNNELLDSNRVKEEYIAHFFDQCSTYINKIETYRKSLYKKTVNKQYEDLHKELKSTELVDTELEEFYNQFDTIFLNIYPTFITDFNKLLHDDEKISPKQGELLNTELRIFALIRLGITDSVKIAGFLRYSLSTIYNYRTKVRNKSAGSRDDFEKAVMKIGSH